VSLALWRDIALIWLALLCFIGLVIPLAVMLFAVKGMHAAVDRTPRLLRQVQGRTRALRSQVDAASYRVSDPVIQMQRRSTHMATVLERLLQRPVSPGTGEDRK
jgi:predicted PurR-regulated permease PerM